MRKVITGLAALLMATSLQAEPAGEEQLMRLCELQGQLAESIMTNRQNGASAVEMMRIAGDHRMSRVITAMAYDEPLWVHEDHKRDAVAIFRDEVYMSCYREYLQ